MPAADAAQDVSMPEAVLKVLEDDVCSIIFHFRECF